jgi:hypothetical protein
LRAAVQLQRIGVSERDVDGSSFDATSVRFDVHGTSLATRATVLGENRTLAAPRGTFSDDFAAYAVHLYRLE